MIGQVYFGLATLADAFSNPVLTTHYGSYEIVVIFIEQSGSGRGDTLLSQAGCDLSEAEQRLNFEPDSRMV